MVIHTHAYTHAVLSGRPDHNQVCASVLHSCCDRATKGPSDLRNNSEDPHQRGGENKALRAHTAHILVSHASRPSELNEPPTRRAAPHTYSSATARHHARIPTDSEHVGGASPRKHAGATAQDPHGAPACHASRAAVTSAFDPSDAAAADRARRGGTMVDVSRLAATQGHACATGSVSELRADGDVAARIPRHRTTESQAPTWGAHGARAHYQHGVREDFEVWTPVGQRGDPRHDTVGLGGHDTVESTETWMRLGQTDGWVHHGGVAVDQVHASQGPNVRLAEKWWDDAIWREVPIVD